MKKIAAGLLPVCTIDFANLERTINIFQAPLDLYDFVLDPNSFTGNIVYQSLLFHHIYPMLCSNDTFSCSVVHNSAHSFFVLVFSNRRKYF
jgi:hypothetical protein